jgi:hypothetical protein
MSNSLVLMSKSRFHLTSIFMLFFAGNSHAFPSVAKSSQPGNSSTQTCLVCHGNREPAINPGSALKSPPLLQNKYSMDWTMYEFKATQSPPFQSIPRPVLAMRGHTSYDWSEKKMTEVYFDRCIDIFPSGNDFSCQFISDHDKTYFITFKLKDLTKAQSCCLWSEDAFWAPRPDVLQNMKFQKQMAIQGEQANWWIYDIPLPGPFGYGIGEQSSRPISFWFPVISGWVQQNFFNYAIDNVGNSDFDLPPICKGKPNGCNL